MSVRLPAGASPPGVPWGAGHPQLPSTPFYASRFCRILTLTLWCRSSHTSHWLPYTLHLSLLPPRSNFCGDTPGCRAPCDVQICLPGLITRPQGSVRYDLRPGFWEHMHFYFQFRDTIVYEVLILSHTYPWCNGILLPGSYPYPWCSGILLPSA